MPEDMSCDTLAMKFWQWKDAHPNEPDSNNPFLGSWQLNCGDGPSESGDSGPRPPKPNQ